MQMSVFPLEKKFLVPLAFILIAICWSGSIYFLRAGDTFTSELAAKTLLPDRAIEKKIEQQLGILELQKQIKRLSSRVAMLESSQSDITAKVPITVMDKKDPDSNSILVSLEEQIDKEKLSRDAYKVGLNASLTEELVDQKWSTETANAIYQVFDDGMPLDSSQVKVDCRTVLCRVDLDVDDMDSLIQLQHRLPGELASLLPRSTSWYDISDGQFNVIFYFAREGHRLPKPND